jgi:hypothetical protein
MAKKKPAKDAAVDDFLDALVWMRRKAKRHEAVDDLIDALIKMRRKAKQKAAKRSKHEARTAKSIPQRSPKTAARRARGLSAKLS